METDPGWGAAFKYGLVALFARGRIWKLRPAITAARAGILGFIYSAIAITGVLTFLGDAEEHDYPFAGLIVLAAAVVSSLAVLFFRYRPPERLRAGATPVDHFLTVATIISAFGAVPILTGFVTFFLGGGYLMFAIGSLVSLVLLLGPGRPTEGMVHRVAERLEPPVPATQLWSEILDPDLTPPSSSHTNKRL